MIQLDHNRLYTVKVRTFIANRELLQGQYFEDTIVFFDFAPLRLIRSLSEFRLKTLFFFFFRKQGWAILFANRWQKNLYQQMLQTELFSLNSFQAGHCVNAA